MFEKIGNKITYLLNKNIKWAEKNPQKNFWIMNAVVPVIISTVITLMFVAFRNL